ncbi:MAG: hypothetical protein LC777_15800 [Actinobacteria bacterium]|nr:hypothetical protein [Actinomycetota bacterium]
MLRRLSFVVAVCACATAVVVGAAVAAPDNRNTFVIPAICDGTEVEFAVVGEGKFSPGHVVGTNMVFVPYSIDVLTTFTPEGGGEPFVEHELAIKPAPGEDLVTCAIDFSTVFPGEGTLEITGTVTGFFTP